MQSNKMKSEKIFIVRQLQVNRQPGFTIHRITILGIAELIIKKLNFINICKRLNSIEIVIFRVILYKAIYCAKPQFSVFVLTYSPLVSFKRIETFFQSKILNRMIFDIKFI